MDRILKEPDNSPIEELSLVMLRNDLVRRINHQVNPKQTDRELNKSYHKMSHYMSQYGAYPDERRWIWYNIRELIHYGTISEATIRRVIAITTSVLKDDKIQAFFLERVREIEE